MNRCDECRFWRQTDEPADGYGECRRRAPQPVNVRERGPGERPMAHHFGHWPVVADVDGCGEWGEV